MGGLKADLKEPQTLFTVKLDEPVIRDLKLFSVDPDKPISELPAEAISGLVRKHGRTEVKLPTRNRGASGETPSGTPPKPPGFPSSVADYCGGL